METIQQGSVKGSGVKRGITEKSVWMEAGMQGKEVGKDRNQRGSVTDRFIFIRGIRFLFDSQFRVSFFKAFIIRKGNVAYNTKPVGKDGKLIGIAEMPVDVHLFGIRAGGGMGRHKSISHGVWINLRLVLVKGFEFPDEGIESFGVVFVDEKLNTGGVKGEGQSQFGINHLTDGISIIHHLLKHEFNIRLKVLFETGQERCIGHLGKTAEIPEFPGQPKEKEQEGIRGDGKDFLKDECGKESFQRIVPFPAKVLVKSIAENGRDEFLDVEMLIKELEERGGIINKHVLGV